MFLGGLAGNGPESPRFLGPPRSIGMKWPESPRNFGAPQVGERFFRCSKEAGSASSVKMIDSMLVRESGGGSLCLHRLFHSLSVCFHSPFAPPFCLLSPHFLFVFTAFSCVFPTACHRLTGPPPPPHQVGIHTVAAAEAITFAAKCGVSPTLVRRIQWHSAALSGHPAAFRGHRAWWGACWTGIDR